MLSVIRVLDSHHVFCSCVLDCCYLLTALAALQDQKAVITCYVKLIAHPKETMLYFMFLTLVNWLVVFCLFDCSLI